MRALDEIKQSGVANVDVANSSANMGIIYILHSGRRVMVDSYGTVWVDLIKTGWWYGRRIRRAIKRAAK